MAGVTGDSRHPVDNGGTYLNGIGRSSLPGWSGCDHCGCGYIGKALVDTAGDADDDRFGGRR
jgi:hypothetical protein